MRAEPRQDLGSAPTAERSTPLYRTIVADPPWEISWPPGMRMRMGGGKIRMSTIHPLPYNTLRLEEICELSVEPLADDDALLFLWATRKVFREGDACRVARSWGFEPCGELIWGLRNPGLGGALGNGHEPILIARKGKAKLAHVTPVGVSFWRQLYDSNGKVHSAKPEGFLDFVEQIAEGPYLELFARRQRLGWDTWGNEVDTTLPALAVMTTEELEDRADAWVCEDTGQ